MNLATNRWSFVALLLLFNCTTPTGRVRAEGVPEPDVVYYGIIRNTGQYNARVTSGDITWRFEQLTNGIPNGRVVTLTAALGNVVGQFSYVLRVPCESSLPSALATNLGALQLVSTTNYYRSVVSVDGFPAAFAVPALASVAASQTLRGRVQQLDLTINDPCDDANHNGICDWWEDLYFGDFVDPNADPDGDGMSNLQEFLAGTNPTDRASAFVFVSSRPRPNGSFEVSWNSSEGRSYTLLRFASVLSTNYTIIRSNIAANPPLNTFVDTNAIPPGPYFYRLKLEL